jgi:uncharacterized protein YecE (DUF72 family)
VSTLRIGTSSWKFDSWEGIIYEPGSPRSYLEQYAELFDTVEIDQWFWSLFESPQPRLPDPATAAEYARSVPADFRFTVKVPNSITLTHHYQRDKSRPLRANPSFLSRELFGRFMEQLEPLEGRIGALILQFEYLNRQKMSGLPEFLDRLEAFVSPALCSLPLAVEIRNPNYLRGEYFRFLEGHGLAPCFLEGYYMPHPGPAIMLWEAERRDSAGATAILRLHGPDREGMDRASGKRWDRILAPKDDEIDGIVDLIGRLLGRKIDVYLNVNNHYEGCAPLTIEKIRTAMAPRNR